MPRQSSMTFFNQTAAVGSRFLKALGGSPAGAEVDRYLGLLEEIYAVLAQIHDGLIDVTIDVSQATTVEEATQALMRVYQMGLKEALKANDMCDELQRLGQQLSGLPADKYGLTAEEKATWDELCQNLQDREAGTARLYDLKLYDLRVLPNTEKTLKKIQTKVEAISRLLVEQKAQFDYLAKLAKAIRAKKS